LTKLPKLLQKMPKTSLKSKPLVSIILQSKNERKTIKLIMDALLNQSFQDFEIINVDDGSTDGTLDIISKYSTSLSIKTIHLKPGEFGYSYSLNLGISKSQAKYICILVGHALPFTDTWLKDGLDNFKDQKVAGMSGYYTENFLGYFSRKLGKFLFKFENKKKLLFSNWMTNTNSIIRKDFWQLYPFDENLSQCEDYDWANEMIARGYNIIIDPKFSVVHSHWYLGRPGYIIRVLAWKKICHEIDQRKRPRKSFSKLEIT
jgi:rhamnosyltransferase